MPSVSEGTVPFREWQTWFRVIGDLNQPAPETTPLLILHGGPGCPHDYLESLEPLAETGRPLVFYDQLGCGRSSRPDEPDLWSVDLFVAELANLRAALGLARMHLLGHSWGGMLALESLLAGAEGVVSLVLASSPASMPLYVTEAVQLRAALPSEVREALEAHEAVGTTDSAAYQAAAQVFNRRHFCRCDPWPEPVQRAFAGVGAQVWETMIGPAGLHVVGKLKDWDVRSRLGELTLPTLITSGRYDEVTEAQAQALHAGIAGSEWVVFAESAHLAPVEEPDRYRETLNRFFARVEEGMGPEPR